MNKRLFNLETEIKLLDKLLESKNHTQRSISKDLGVALGVANALIKKFMKKGLLKLSSAPVKRYFYYVTTKGFVEKAKLRKEYIHSSLDFYRKVRSEYEKIFIKYKNKKIILVGTGELCEIAILSANFTESNIVSIFDPSYKEKRFCGVKVVKNIKESHFDFIFVLTRSDNALKLTESVKNKKIEMVKPKFLKVS